MDGWSVLQVVSEYPRIELDSLGVGSAPPLVGASNRGTAAAPLAPQPSDCLLTLAGRGLGATAVSDDRANIGMFATENWTDTAQGAALFFYTTLNGTNALAARWSVGHDGGLFPIANNAYDLGNPTLRVADGLRHDGRLFGGRKRRECLGHRDAEPHVIQRDAIVEHGGKLHPLDGQC